MSKIYYASSDGSIRGSDGGLYHWGWKKKDAKYIKRERKNGKWVYTYPEDSTKTGSKKVDPPISNKKKQVTAGKNLINTRGDSGKGTGPRTMSKEYEAELGYNSKKNEYPSPKMTTNQSSKANTGKNTTTTNTNTKGKVSDEYLAEVAYNSKKNVYPRQYTSDKVNGGRSVLGVADGGAADTDIRKQAEVKAFVASVRENAKKTSANKTALEKRGTAGSGSVEKVDPKQVEQAKNVADFWKAFKASKTFYERGNAGVPDATTKETIVERRENQKINALEYEKYLEYKKRGAASAREFEEWKNKPESNYWQDIENDIPKKPEFREDRGFIGTLVDAAKNWWGDDEREHYQTLVSEKYTRDRIYNEASDKAWKTLDELTELETASREGTKKVTQRELESAYASFWNAASYLDYVTDIKYALDDVYEQAENDYRKTKAFQIDQKVQAIEDLVESAGDSIDSGRDWIEDRIDDLEDWIDEIRRK